MKPHSCVSQLVTLGINPDDARSLRRISMTLQRWFECECGSEYGIIERDEKTNTPYFYNTTRHFVDPHDPRARSVIPDRESGAYKRLAKIMSRYPTLTSFVQTDPRGCALYILRQEDIIEGKPLDEYYSRGIAVYK